MIGKFRMAAKALESVCLTITQILLLFMTVVIVTLVVSRYVFAYSFPWAEELTNFMQTWMVMLASAVLLWRDEHIRLDFIADRLPLRSRQVLGLFVRVLILLFLVILVRYGVQVAMNMWPVRAAALRIPMTWVYLSLPVGGGLMLLYCLLQVVQDVTRLCERSSVGFDGKP